MKCEQCGMALIKTKNFCSFCGKDMDIYKGVRHVSKNTIDEAFPKREFDYLWQLIDTGQEPYAEYKYERFILGKAEKIDTPNDFKIFIRKIEKKSETGNLYAKYLYGKAMMRVFRERGLLSGLASFMGNVEKYREGIRLIREAATNGQTSARWTVGSWMWEGNKDANIMKNEREAYRQISFAAQKGHPMAMLKLGEIYNQGLQGVERNFQKAQLWLKSAAYFDCKTTKIEIREEKNLIRESDVEEIAEFYRLGEDNAQNKKPLLQVKIDYS